MTDNILYRIRAGDVQLLEEALRSWQADGRDSRLVHDVEESVRVCLDLPEHLQEVWHAVLRRQTGIQPADEFQQTGERLRDLFVRALQVVENLRVWIANLEHEGYSVRRSEELAGVTERMQQLRQDFMNSWLWITPEIIQEAREEYVRGEYQTVREILDELQGKNP